MPNGKRNTEIGSHVTAPDNLVSFTASQTRLYTHKILTIFTFSNRLLSTLGLAEVNISSNIKEGFNLKRFRFYFGTEKTKMISVFMLH